MPPILRKQKKRTLKRKAIFLHTTHVFADWNGLPLAADLYRAAANRKDTTVLYLHGGGLVYGTRDDLPQLYIDLFLEQGYDLISFDYPLAPETKLPAIHDAVFAAFRWFLREHESVLQLPSGRYFLFGRSAGAYLALLLADRIRRKDLPPAAGILSFYGYPGFALPEFESPSPFYLKFPRADAALVERMTGGGPVAYGPMVQRYAIYLYARQTGNWLRLLTDAPEDIARYALREDALHCLPPLFLTASTGDQDVPYRVSKQLKKARPDAVLDVYKRQALCRPVSFCSSFSINAFVWS